MKNRWSIVLAGGEGSRIRDLTRDPGGIAVPKQFCCFRDGRSLLRRALDRAAAWSDSMRIVPVVMAHHRSWWEPELAALAPDNVVEQSENRGTAAAIWRAVLRIARRDPDALVLILPSDHDVDDEPALSTALVEARHVASRCRDQLVLIGMEPQDADSSYGWIVPSTGVPAPRVMAFVEKPAPTEAARLLELGALINSFLIAGYVHTLERLIRMGLPELASGRDESVCDFSRDLLPRVVSRLRVVAAPPCGWADLGTPERLSRWLDRHDEAFVWQSRPPAPAAATPKESSRGPIPRRSRSRTTARLLHPVA